MTKTKTKAETNLRLYSRLRDEAIQQLRLATILAEDGAPISAAEHSQKAIDTLKMAYEARNKGMNNL